MLLYIIILVACISYIYDKLNNQNFKDYDVLCFNFTLYIHHFLASFIILCIFSNNLTFLKFYVSVVAVVNISWLIFRDRCVLTVLTNRLCDIPDDIEFQGIFGKIFKGISKTTESTKSVIEYIGFPSLILIGLLKIGWINKNQ